MDGNFKIFLAIVGIFLIAYQLFKYNKYKRLAKKRRVQRFLWK